MNHNKNEDEIDYFKCDCIEPRIKIDEKDSKGACSCPPGYKSDVITNECIDIDECLLSSNDKKEIQCHDSAICTNLIGSVKCECPEGLFGDGFLSCDDFDECSQVGFQAPRVRDKRTRINWS